MNLIKAASARELSRQLGGYAILRIIHRLCTRIELIGDIRRLVSADAENTYLILEIGEDRADKLAHRLKLLLVQKLRINIVDNGDILYADLIGNGGVGCLPANEVAKMVVDTTLCVRTKGDAARAIIGGNRLEKTKAGLRANAVELQRELCRGGRHKRSVSQSDSIEDVIACRFLVLLD